MLLMLIFKSEYYGKVCIFVISVLDDWYTYQCSKEIFCELQL